jgi:hypothetical protein
VKRPSHDQSRRYSGIEKFDAQSAVALFDHRFDRECFLARMTLNYTFDEISWISGNPVAQTS